MNKDLLAKIISRALGPPVLLLSMIVLLVFETDLSAQQIFGVLPLLLTTHLLIPVGFFIWAFKRGLISDLEVRSRSERILPYTVGIISLTIGTFLTRMWGTSFFFRLILLTYLLGLVLTLVTFFWKISLHTAFNTGFYLLLNFLFAWRFWWFFPVILVVAWARWQIRNHNLGQLVGGMVVAGVVIQGGLLVLF